MIIHYVLFYVCIINDDNTSVPNGAYSENVKIGLTSKTQYASPY